MNPSDKDAVGYCRPPKSAQWTKGQSGNPGGKKRIKKLSRVIEEIFHEEVELAEGGLKKRITVFEAILLQLWLKQSKGSRRAMRVLKKYAAFAKANPKYVVQSDIDREAAAAAYERMLNEPVTMPESWKKLTANEAAEIYYAMLQEGD
jgi:hypothetical protein